MSHVIPRPILAHPGPACWGPAYELIGLLGNIEAPAELRTWAVGCLRACARPYAASEDLADALKLVASELATNAVTHSASGEDGGFFVSAIHFTHEVAALSVFDLGPKREGSGAPKAPPLALDVLDTEYGRGLGLVALQSRRYGWAAPPRSAVHTVWAELSATTLEVAA